MDKSTCNQKCKKQDLIKNSVKNVKGLRNKKQKDRTGEAGNAWRIGGRQISTKTGR